MADLIIKGYKEAIEGTTVKDIQEKFKDEKLKNDNELVKSVSEKGYTLLTELVVSHKIMDVPDSDFSAQPVPLVSWNDIPQNDAIAFLFKLLNEAQVATTTEGGEVSADEITTFPDGEQVPKRNLASKSRKAVR